MALSWSIVAESMTCNWMLLLNRLRDLREYKYHDVINSKGGVLWTAVSKSDTAFGTEFKQL